MIQRAAENTIRDLANGFKAITITGPRQSGKTTLARSIFERDDAVDKIAREAFDELIAEMKKDPVQIEPCAHIMSLLRHIERLADHATNIAEDVIFIVEAKMMKHQGQ